MRISVSAERLIKNHLHKLAEHIAFFIQMKDRTDTAFYHTVRLLSGEQNSLRSTAQYRQHIMIHKFTVDGIAVVNHQITGSHRVPYIVNFILSLTAYHIHKFHQTGMGMRAARI